MAIKVCLPVSLRRLTAGQAEIEAQATTLNEVVDELERRFPGLGAALRDEQGQARRFVNFYVNSEDIRFRSGLATALQPGDEVRIVPAVSGGNKD